MDVLKKQLNDIGSCIGYPFYFFEDGSFSSTFVNGKMNACLVVKGAFAESDKCFFASAKIAKLSEVKALEKGWTQKSVVPNTVNWFKKYLNDIGGAINYPFYVFDDGAYAQTSSLDDKQAVLYVKQPFTSVEGECTFSSPDEQKVKQFNDDLKKVQQQQNDRKDIVFRMLACEKVPDKEALQVIEKEPHDLVKRCVHSVWKECNYAEILKIYPKSFDALVKKNWWDIYCFDEQEFLYFCLCEDGCEHFFTLVFQYAIPEVLKEMLGLCLMYNFYSEIEKKYKVRDHFDVMLGYRRRAVERFYPLYLIERRDAEAYKVYRKYLGQQYKVYIWDKREYCTVSYDLHVDEEIDAIVALGDREWFKILFDGISLSTERKAKLIRTGNIEMIQVYIECCGIDEKFRDLLMYSGNDELVKLANQPEPSTHQVSQEDKASQEDKVSQEDEVSHANMVSEKSGGLFQKIRKFFGASA